MRRKPDRWNTPRLAVIGAFIGAGYALWQSMTGEMPPPTTLYGFGGVFGGAVGGAAMFAATSGIRNLFIRD